MGQAIIWTNLDLTSKVLSAIHIKHGLTLIPAWISNHMPCKVWDEITYPILNFQQLHCWSLGMDK